MPRGGHFGIWVPTGKDIFKSRWKRFYKRSYRGRTPANLPDRAPPHEPPRFNPDGVPSPWRFRYSLDNFGPGSFPPDSWKAAAPWVRTQNPQMTYGMNFKHFMKPIFNTDPATRRPRGFSGSPAAQDAVLRALDPGRRGGGDRVQSALHRRGVQELRLPRRRFAVRDVVRALPQLSPGRGRPGHVPYHSPRGRRGRVGGSLKGGRVPRGTRPFRFPCFDYTPFAHPP
jgi:hypothetical protein